MCLLALPFHTVVHVTRDARAAWCDSSTRWCDYNPPARSMMMTMVDGGEEGERVAGWGGGGGRSAIDERNGSSTLKPLVVRGCQRGI